MTNTPVRTTLSVTATLLGAASQPASAFVVDVAPGVFFNTLPYSDTGTTIGAVNDIPGIKPGVSNYPQVPGPDVFYSFIVTNPGLITIRLTPLGNTGYDPAFYLLKDGTAGSDAIRGRDEELANVAEQLTGFPLGVGTYHIGVDSFFSTGAASAGAFRLDVSGTVELALIPEPGTAALAAATLGTAVWRRRRRGACR